jgi:hypothetical protein
MNEREAKPLLDFSKNKPGVKRAQPSFSFLPFPLARGRG